MSSLFWLDLRIMLFCEEFHWGTQRGGPGLGGVHSGGPGLGVAHSEGPESEHTLNSGTWITLHIFSLTIGTGILGFLKFQNGVSCLQSYKS